VATGQLGKNACVCVWAAQTLALVSKLGEGRLARYETTLTESPRSKSNGTRLVNCSCKHNKYGALIDNTTPIGLFVRWRLRTTLSILFVLDAMIIT
jgi:hypothetical protein